LFRTPISLVWFRLWVLEERHLAWENQAAGDTLSACRAGTRTCLETLLPNRKVAGQGKLGTLDTVSLLQKKKIKPVW